MAEEHTPYISDKESLPEITPKAIVLGILLSAVLAAANAYLGLFAGMTVSASIPAAVISMGVLRLFKESNVLENNIVQTAASAGESLAAGVIFTIPALVLMKAWTEFNYIETTVMAGLGGIIGVLFTIPLRRALIVESDLKFPEGVATAEVLKVGDAGGSGVLYVLFGSFLGGIFKFGATGLRLWHEVMETAFAVGKSTFYLGSNLSPALIAVGYIVGLEIAVLVFAGGALNWWLVIPVLAASRGIDVTNASEAAWTLWSTQTRYLGVGAMVVGGLWALISMRQSLVSGVASGIQAYRDSKSGKASSRRTDQDAPMQWVAIALVVCLIPLAAVFYQYVQSPGVALVMAVIMMVAGFLFSAVAGYMAGLVGSSNNPISGVTIATILTSSILLYFLMGPENPLGPPAAIFIGAVVCCAAAIAGDNMQDLKAGHVLGATPYRQQIMQVIGVLASAAVMAPILTLILKAYGIGEVTEAHPEPLAAPQATLMMSVAQGVFGKGLPKDMVALGALLAILVIFLDEYLRKTGASFRTPVLAVAVGVYLPLELEVPIILGGLIAWFSARALTHWKDPGVIETGKRQGLLFSAGLITGEALVGIALAIPIVYAGNRDVLAISTLLGRPFELSSLVRHGLEAGLMVGVMGILYYVATRPEGAGGAEGE